MTDETETYRRNMIGSGQPHRDLQAATRRWTLDELKAEFEVLAFQAPFVVARRKADGKLGSFEFTHSPRVYFNWHEDQP
jgi:hypothetical protein